jgi:hypothetical protein
MKQVDYTTLEESSDVFYSKTSSIARLNTETKLLHAMISGNLLKSTTRRHAPLFTVERVSSWTISFSESQSQRWT